MVLFYKVLFLVRVRLGGEKSRRSQPPGASRAVSVRTTDRAVVDARFRKGGGRERWCSAESEWGSERLPGAEMLIRPADASGGSLEVGGAGLAAAIYIAAAEEEGNGGGGRYNSWADGAGRKKHPLICFFFGVAWCACYLIYLFQAVTSIFYF